MKLEVNATMANVTTKKLLLTAGLVLSGAFVLASCDNVTAVPQNYETPIVVKNGQDIDDEENVLGKIYDAISSNKSAKVVSTLLEKIANNEFGTFEEVEKCFSVSGDAESIKLGAAKAHIAKYAHEFAKEEDYDIKKGVTEAEVEAIRIDRFKDFYRDVNERIDSVIFSEISSDSYRDTINKTEFLEEKYARAKREQNYDIAGFNEDGSTSVTWKDRFLDDSFKEENVREYLEDFSRYADYVNRKIIPDVYKDKLVEEYVIASNYSALGRAYGRQINYVKVSYSDDDPNTTYNLVKNFVANELDNVARKEDDMVDYSDLVNWVKGLKGVTTNDDGDAPAIVPLTAEDEAILTPIYGEPVKISPKCDKEPARDFSDQVIALNKYGFGPTFKYYEKTKLGDILKNYEKAIVGEQSRFASSEDVSQFNDFTNNGKRSKEQGLMQKITDLALNSSDSFAKEGWFVKNDASGALSSMPEAIKNRLFNIKVANDFDKPSWVYEKGESYFTKVFDHAYLTPAENSDAAYDFILRDTGSKSYYIIEILEAPSTSKLNKTSDKSYVKTDAWLYKTESVARQIAKILGTKDTYTTSAYTSYLELYTFTYHDTDVYEYLEATYPDLFEDD